MPPKTATNAKRDGKNKRCTAEVHSPPKSNASVNNDTVCLDPEAEDRFEVELYWCIQQFETLLSVINSKLSSKDKQVQMIKKHMNTLRNTNTSLVKKRYIMRCTFGNYRDKMAEEELKLGKNVSSVKFITPTKINKNSRFIRKATQHSAEKPEVQTEHHETQDTLVSAGQSVIKFNRTPTPFRFNFQMC